MARGAKAPFLIRRTYLRKPSGVPYAPLAGSPAPKPVEARRGPRLALWGEGVPLECRAASRCVRLTVAARIDSPQNTFKGPLISKLLFGPIATT